MSQTTVPSDLDIAQSAALQPITDIAAPMGLERDTRFASPGGAYARSATSCCGICEVSGRAAWSWWTPRTVWFWVLVWESSKVGSKSAIPGSTG